VVRAGGGGVWWAVSGGWCLVEVGPRQLQKFIAKADRIKCGTHAHSRISPSDKGVRLYM